MNRDESELTRRVAVVRQGSDLQGAIREALERSGIMGRVSEGARVALKPNLTYPYYKEGVTTSPRIIWETLRVLLRRASHVAVVETEDRKSVV